MKLRAQWLNNIRQLFRNHSIVALLGPRQCGKTTLAKQYANTIKVKQYFDLEKHSDFAQLQEPQLTLQRLKGLIIIDEIQRLPDLFSLLRALVDEKKSQNYLILGSASRELIKQSSESLAGRIAYLELTPFGLQEIPRLEKLWLRGGFPKSILASSNVNSWQWRENYISTYLEQDIPNLGIHIPAATLRRFWMMLTHYHANIFNASELASAFATADTTVRRYLDILSGTFMVRQLQPWHENIGKRQVKAPKIYFRDSGILHFLLGLQSEHDLFHSHKLGASWEGFALEEIIRFHRAKPHECYFWATHGGAELDLLMIQGRHRIGFEFKYSATPQITKSMQISMQDLGLSQLFVIHPGDGNFPLGKNIRAMGLCEYVSQYSKKQAIVSS